MPDQSLLCKRHPELFHYTGVAGLEGILRSQCLWATHWQHLNDAKELEHFADALPRLIKPRLLEQVEDRARKDEDFKRWLLRSGGADRLCDKESRGLAKTLLESLIAPDPTSQIFEFYVTSLCTPEGAYEGVRTHGLLSQWRYYGQQGGYAIVFDTGQLEELMRLEHDHWKCAISLGEVAYSSDPPDVLESRIDAVRPLLETLGACKFESADECETLLVPLQQCFVHYKHWCFAEEREVRLVAILNGPKARALHQEDGTDWPERRRHYYNDVPRISLFEGLDVQGRPYRLPIRRIIVGPGPHQSERETKLRALLDEIQYDTAVTLAEMPIRF